MDGHVIPALNSVETVEISTIGRSSGLPRRLEIWMYEIDGRYVITGTPGVRDWYANVMANPHLILHLPGGIDLTATATSVVNPAFRRRVFTAAKTAWYRSQAPVEDLIANSPMIELTFNPESD